MADTPRQDNPDPKEIPAQGKSRETDGNASLFLEMVSPQFQNLMDNVPDLIWAKDMTDQYLFVNQAICRTLLMCDSTDEPMGKTDLYFSKREKEKGFLHTFGEICVNSDQVIKAKKEPGRFIEEGFVRGKYLVLDVHKAPLTDREGNMVGTIGSARDITAQKAIEKKLKKSEERFRQMADMLPLPIAEFDFDLNLYYANRAGLKTFGFTQMDFHAHPGIDRLIPASRKGQVQQYLEQIKRGMAPKPFEIQLVKKDGSYIFGVIHASPIVEDNRVVAVRACFTDLTDRRVAEIALQESETRFKTLFNGLNDAVFVHPYADQGFETFVEVNEVACQWYGYTRAELLEMTPQDLILDPEGKGMGSRASRQNLKALGKRTIETLNRRKNNEIFPVEISSSMFEFHGQAMILSTVRDITDRRQSEKEREDAVKFAAEQEKYALVGQVAGKMAHDFNNILSGIMGNAELSLMDCQKGPIRETLEIILEQTLRGKNMTKNLVAFARDQEPKEEFFNINQKIDLVLNLMKMDLTGIRVDCRLAEGLPDLLADSGMIEHALVNLVQNSIHAMSRVAVPQLTIATAFSENQIHIEIRDNGCGIPRSCQSQIYTPAFTLKGSKDLSGAYDPEIKGTGYGMANVKKYIQKHRGTITFTSREKEGTAFRIAIPLIHKELTQVEKRRMARKQMVPNKKILLVEDEPAISGVQQKILSNAPFHHTVVLAATGQEAIEAFDREAFDLVSLDYLLPGKLNGMDVYSHIRRKNEAVPIVFLSGNIGFLESMKSIREKDPLMDYLSKPCENIVFADTINTWLSRTEG